MAALAGSAALLLAGCAGSREAEAPSASEQPPSPPSSASAAPLAFSALPVASPQPPATLTLHERGKEPHISLQIGALRPQQLQVTATTELRRSDGELVGGGTQRARARVEVQRDDIQYRVRARVVELVDGDAGHAAAEAAEWVLEARLSELAVTQSLGSEPPPESLGFTLRPVSWREPLPEDAVGVGARWTVERVETSEELTLKTDYEVLSLNAEELLVAVSRSSVQGERSVQQFAGQLRYRFDQVYPLGSVSTQAQVDVAGQELSMRSTLVLQ